MLVKRTHDFQCEQEVMVQRTKETLTFHGLPTFHDNFNGRRRGPNTVWHWYWEGIHFAHWAATGTCSPTSSSRSWAKWTCSSVRSAAKSP